MTKKAVLYARVSTDDQADKGYSLPSQVDAMRKYAEREGFEIVAEFQDDYSGATPIEFRPEGSKAYALLKSDGADAIIAYAIDRFVRPPEDGDEWELPILIRGLAKTGKEIHTVRRGKLNTSFADLLIALLDARKAGEERRDIRERSMRGKRAKVKSGKVTGHRAPFGYRHTRDEHGKTVNFEIVEEEARIVRLIFTWYARGDEQGKRLSAAAIAKRLSEMHTPTPGQLRRGYHRKRNDGMWHACKVIEIIAHEVYAGVWWYGGRIGNSRKRRAKDEQIAVQVPAIVRRDLWDRAQIQRQQNKAFSFRNAKRDYLLHGLVKCNCGYARCGNYFSNHTYYSCSSRQNHFGSVETRDCRRGSVRADALEADVWDEIRELFSDLEGLLEKLKFAQQTEEGKQKPIREQMQITDDLIKQAELELDEIARAMRAARGERMIERFAVQQDEVNARLDDLFKQREKHAHELATRRIADDRSETMATAAERVRRGIERAEFEGKRRILETLGVSVIAEPGKYHIDCVVGSTDGELRSLKANGGTGFAPSSQMPCTSLPVFLSTTRSRACTVILTCGWISSRHTSQPRSTPTTSVKITPMHI